MMAKEIVRLAAVGDIHCSKSCQGKLEAVFARAAELADVLVLCGDLTDYGLAEEARILVRELSAAGTIPIVAVLGNHDYENGRPEEVCEILGEAGVIMLEGQSCELEGVGFAGAKGFAGGFGKKMINPWGEATMKAFVHEGVEEALKLESALAKLHTEQRVAVLHYSPIEATVIGEQREIFPFLGTTRLEDALSRHPVSMVFHGHAHHGSLEGRTSRDVAVYNVAMPLLSRHFPDQPPFRLVDVEVMPSATMRRAESTAMPPSM
jgi:Icc-related predicted phosphoesterase